MFFTVGSVGKSSSLSDLISIVNQSVISLSKLFSKGITLQDNVSGSLQDIYLEDGVAKEVLNPLQNQTKVLGALALCAWDRTSLTPVESPVLTLDNRRNEFVKITANFSSASNAVVRVWLVGG